MNLSPGANLLNVRKCFSRFEFLCLHFSVSFFFCLAVSKIRVFLLIHNFALLSVFETARQICVLSAGEA